MERLLDDLDKSAPSFAKARQIVEFASDRRKCALGDCIAAILKEDPECSATAAEHRARASTLYKARMKELVRDHIDAETAISLHDVLKSRLDVARSLTAIERAKLEHHL